MKLSFLTIFLSFQLLIAAPTLPQTPSPPPIPALISFKLVVLWPNTFCLFQPSSSPCQLKPQTFTLHGLWPQAGGQSIHDCAAPKIDDATFSRYKDDLNNYWPDLMHAKFEESKSFWQYEWEKHDSCSRMTPATYLSQVFDLMKQFYDVKQILAEKGVKPDPKGYAMTKFGKAIFNKTKLYTTIQCAGENQTSEQYLYQIFFCLNAQAQFIDCSNSHKYIDCTKDPVIMPLP